MYILHHILKCQKAGFQMQIMLKSAIELHHNPSYKFIFVPGLA